jgi:hypothetical protein
MLSRKQMIRIVREAVQDQARPDTKCQRMAPDEVVAVAASIKFPNASTARVWGRGLSEVAVWHMTSATVGA